MINDPLHIESCPVEPTPRFSCGSSVPSHRSEDATECMVGCSTVRLRWEDGTVFEGAPSGNFSEAQGVCVFPSRCVCAGTFIHGCVEGQADVLLPSGEVFRGNFRGSVAHDEGVFFSGKGFVHGRWFEGVLVEQLDDAAGVRGDEKTCGRIAKTLRRFLNLRSASTDGPSARFVKNVDNSIRMKEPLVLLSNSGGRIVDSGGLSTSFEMRVHSDRTPNSVHVPSNSPIKGSGIDQLAHVHADTSSLPSLGMKCRVAPPEKTHAAAFAKSMFASGATPHALFASAAPAPNEFFVPSRYIQCFVSLLFPVLSLPFISFSPLRRIILNMEREFVASGAYLLRAFHIPTYSLYTTTVALFCYILAAVFVAVKVEIGRVDDGRLTCEEMLVPLLVWVTYAAMYAGYNSYTRTAHALERLDRRLSPQLFAFAAGLVDTKAKVCIYTWNDEGRGVVANAYYRYRWLAWSCLVGLLMGLVGPITRAGYGQPIFGSGSSENWTMVFVSLSNALFSSTVTYYILKLTDMQRQVKEQMHVLTRLAYLEGKSMMHPCEHMAQRFNMEEPFNVNNVFSGVVGWYVVRSVVMYSATCSNHAARGLAMSVFFAFIVSIFIVIIGVAAHTVACGYQNSLTYFTCAHAYGFVLCVTWGVMLLRYLYICVEVNCEHERHLYVLDVASMYHHIIPRSRKSDSSAIARCRDMVMTHDRMPSIFLFRVTPLIVTTLVFLHVIAFFVLFLGTYMVISNRKLESN
uniref:MORN repeat protein n=1 Tax=Trypanosoma vivax (strain Y486) TaxID=1055687 RepID=G0TW16_TRYVY|nr:conserved hypothetical protein [Trypanosoma vivax Y486]